mmetsp:Transcript_1640/g.4157  ORF Transcript_1640/g.4157 Transcript_1640/m.4157 type:complete len:179 (+) Transcript_1640:3-539(+)
MNRAWTCPAVVIRASSFPVRAGVGFKSRMASCFKGIGTFCSRGSKQQEEDEPLAEAAQKPPTETSSSRTPAPMQVTSSDNKPKEDPKPVMTAPPSTSPPAKVEVCNQAKQVEEFKPVPQPVPKATSAPAPKAAAASTNQAQKPEKRRAKDGRAYTYNDFVWYFGKKEGDLQWKYAKRI